MSLSLIIIYFEHNNCGMGRVFYHCSHEQFTPSELLKLSRLAADCGFTGIHCSDHFSPWTRKQGCGGHSFSWLGAAMQTTNLPFGLVCTAGFRQHPAVVAQAIATLCEMYPGRLFLSLGSGEAINESITGTPWPDKNARNIQMKECYTIIKDLLSGRQVNHTGAVTVRHAKLYTLPSEMPRILGAALSEETAGWLGGWAEGLLTANKKMDKLKKVVDSFREGGGAGKPMALKVQISFSDSLEAAEEGALDQWRANVLPSGMLSELSHISQFESCAHLASLSDLHENVHISAACSDFVPWLQDYLDLGFEDLILHNVNKNQELFIKSFGNKVLPNLKF